MKSIEIETEIPDITYLVTKAGLNTKSTETRCKYLKSTKVALNRRSAGIEKKTDTGGFLTTSVFNRLAKISFETSSKEAAKNLSSKGQVDNGFDIAIKFKKTLKILQTFHLSYINGRRYFDDDGSRYYLSFQL